MTPAHHLSYTHFRRVIHPPRVLSGLELKVLRRLSGRNKKSAKRKVVNSGV